MQEDGSTTGRSDAAATTDSDVSSRPQQQQHHQHKHLRRRSSTLSSTERMPSAAAAGLTRDQLQTHTYGKHSSGELDLQENDGSEGESADIFGDLGPNFLPWRRSAPSLKQDTAPSLIRTGVTSSGDMSDLTKNVYDTYSAREDLLASSYNGARYYMTENYLETELGRYELLMKEMMNNSALKSVSEIDIKLKTTAWDECADGSLNMESVRDQKICSIKITWLLKTLKASEDFHMKSSLVRNMFRRTNSFFDELNDMEVSYLVKKHLRELAKRRMLQKLRKMSVNGRDCTDRIDALEIVHHRNAQHCEVRNLKELYIRMLQKEWGGLESHLSMLETLYNTLHRVYIDVMNLKIRGVEEWCAFRKRHDASTKDAIRHIHEQCVSEFREFKERDRISEMNVVKREAEEDREKRKEVFGKSTMGLSSELVFNMNVSSRNKSLYVLDDTSSAGTFDMDDGDVDAADIKASHHNTAYLKLIKVRMVRKAHLEAKYNRMLDTVVQKRESAEIEHLQHARRHEREFLKAAMKRYFKDEVALEEKIQEFLRHEKHAIEALKTKQAGEMESLLVAQEVEIARLEKDCIQNNQGVSQLLDAKSELHDRHHETMLTAHCFHELRNVLASILCLGENLREDPSSLNAIVEEQADVCTYALDTMSDMLSIAKIKEATFRCNRTRIAVSELFDAVIRIQGCRALKGVRVLKIMDDAELCIWSDKKLLLQLFVNMLSNACKFTVTGIIALWCARLPDKEGGMDVCIGVVDTGSGVQNMPRGGKRDLSTVQGFVETHSEVSGDISNYQSSGYKVRNTGYGLYLASTVATALGSKLRVQSPVGHAHNMPIEPGCPGSFFYMAQEEYTGTASEIKSLNDSVMLEAEEEEDRGRCISSAVTERTKTVHSSGTWRFMPRGCMKVLVVDDQKLLRQTMILTLKKMCERYSGLTMHIHTACCAEEALRKHRQTPYDLITMDQYYDQILLSHIDQAGEKQQMTLVLDGSSPDQNRAAYIAFKEQENFHITTNDGELLGTDVISSLKMCGSPIVISCTASDNVDGPTLDKPYTLDTLITLLQEQMQRYLTDGSVTLDGSVLRKNSQLSLYAASE
jgi:signal transduction histidine kinase/CheY-like chemotaxis protein